MKKALPICLLFLTAQAFSQQVLTHREREKRYPGHVLVLLADSPVAFTVTLNGIKQNSVPLSQIRLIEIYRNLCHVRLDFADNSIQPIIIEDLRLNETDTFKSKWWVSVYRVVVSENQAQLVLIQKVPWRPNMKRSISQPEVVSYTGLTAKERSYPEVQEKKSNAKPAPIPPKPKEPIGPAKKDRKN